MSTNPIEDTTTPKPTGSLEDLFRHHLGDEAAVPPRPLLWDQIDNSLLVRQNETYRRRLTATRWVAAASLLLATLAGTGWWAHRAADLAGPKMATAPRATDAGQAAPGNTPAYDGRQGSGQTPVSNAAGSAVATNTPAANVPGEATSGFEAATSPATIAANSDRRNAASNSNALGNNLKTSVAAAGKLASKSNAATTIGTSGVSSATTTNTQAATRGDEALVASTTPSAPNQSLAPNTATNPSNTIVAATESATGGRVASGAAAGSTAVGLTSQAAPAPALASFNQVAAATFPGSVGFLTANTASLSLASTPALPEGLATVASAVAEAEPVLAAEAHKWRFGASYTASAFNPNVNFSRAGIESEYDYNPVLGPGSPALTEAAAAQYRQNLRPGLGQRIALVASRHLAGHFTLRTGLEVSQARATSASSQAFVGEQINDIGQSGAGPLSTTSFRYRTAGIPVELTYGNPTKRGWSFYGRIGGVVGALLGVRSEVEGEPEATKTYSIVSAGGPYRRLLGSVRGGAGTQFRPGNSNWAFSLGPVAELGLMPLNAHPAQRFTAQSRPYSFGVEAGVEFGK